MDYSLTTFPSRGIDNQIVDAFIDPKGTTERLDSSIKASDSCMPRHAQAIKTPRGSEELFTCAHYPDRSQQRLDGKARLE